jgi:CheY-like chemotaxis protein
MDSLQLWILVGSIACLLAVGLGYRALLRNKGRRRARREQLEAAAWAEAQRLVSEKAERHRAKQEAAAQQAARDAAAEAARIEAVHAAAAEAERAQAFRLAVEEAARAEAHAEALRRAEDEAARDRLARAAVEESARLEVERLAAESAALNASLNALPSPPPLTIALPAAAAEPACVVAPKSPEETLVMVADDSRIVRVKTGRLLAQHHYRVAFATDGLEAVQQIEASMPDIVITDVDMPGMDGFELTRQVRQNPRTRHIPVIMITAADDRHRDAADRAGVSVLLGKPYPEEELIAHIRQAMNRDAAMAATHA